MKLIKVDDDIHLDLKIIAALKGLTIKDIVRDAVTVYKLKYRLVDRIKDFKE